MKTHRVRERLPVARTRHSNSPSDTTTSPSAIHSLGSNASTSTDWKIASKKLRCVVGLQKSEATTQISPCPSAEEPDPLRRRSACFLKARYAFSAFFRIGVQSNVRMNFMRSLRLRTFGTSSFVVLIRTAARLALCTKPASPNVR
jgi:hypothetical protein